MSSFLSARLRPAAAAAVVAAAAGALLAWPAPARAVSAPWAVLAAPTLGDALGATVTSTGQWFLADRGMGGAPEVQTWQSGSWTQPGGPGGTTVDGPTLVATSTGAVDLFIRSITDHLYENVWSAGRWSGWSNLGGTLASRPTAVLTPQGLEVFAAGTDGAVWQTLDTAGGWTAWSRVGGSLLAGTGPAAAVDPASGQVSLFGTGPDHQVYTTSSLAPGVWAPWTSLGSASTHTPAALSTGAGQVGVYIVGTDGRLWMRTQSATAGWGAWTNLGGAFNGGPAVATLSGQLRVYATGATPTLWSDIRSTSGSWSGWRPVVPPQPTSEPLASPSQYTTDMTGSATQDASTGYSHGCTRAQSGHPGLLVLDYGRQMTAGGTWGTEKVLSYGTFLSDADIVGHAEAFLRGFRACANGREIGLLLALGTSNEGITSTEGSTAGAVWATHVVNPVVAYAQAQGYTNLNMGVAGADDIEPGFGGVYGAWNWAKAYAHYNPYPYFDYGSADGCPGYGGGTACSDGWNVGALWQVSNGLATSRSIPEIYTPSWEPLTQGSQWANISLWGREHMGRAIPFAGEMTQYGACQQVGGCTYTGNTPAQGWSELYGDVESHSATKVPVFPYSTDIRYD